ncbi:hypothetical protein [Mycobacteroides abscessus]|uniref:hypothetical protein n=1 Tax=Mycobacteroides abscessus TaxID=36809 RepID=UPI0002684306|nr:hypothetical protein [Mycobacteroides abscessus]QST88989.1 hypothetical protein PROPHIGD100A-2_5 [Mycobacterium phage prophi100A-2]QST89738.1 hypothetical protein PROPHIGD43A-3_5 [Mycobacterium phage prophiGD43A-3]QST90459.1 hypothetical protein PROPHIGD33-1_5 [Mycobacterium phage prophiGD33-1]AKP59803.1 hypothetical protein MAUC22_21235 [Mycobacteroides abscessus UC22]EIV22773.1 hypothetical protein MA3A0119R_4006 [Mycobacteroides abscessus 3A-0119-R]
MTITFDPNPTFDELMAAFDKAEQKCSPNVANNVLDLQIADLFERLGNRGIAVLVANQKAWRESVKESGTDPQCAWTADATAEVVLVEFFTDRDNRDKASAVIRASEVSW